MCLFTSALRASVNKSHIPSLPQNNLYIVIAKSLLNLRKLRKQLTNYDTLMGKFVKNGMKL
jgi:hypothetical protein